MYIGPQDLYWLAGLLEGEGTFGFRTGSGKDQFQPRLRLAMTDKDVIERAARIMNTSHYSYKNSARENEQLLHCCTLTCSKAANLMKLILPHMGERRSTKIKEILVKYENRPNKRKTEEGDSQFILDLELS
jgi:hypothetical protein